MAELTAAVSRPQCVQLRHVAVCGRLRAKWRRIPRAGSDVYRRRRHMERDEAAGARGRVHGQFPHHHARRRGQRRHRAHDGRREHLRHAVFDVRACAVLLPHGGSVLVVHAAHDSLHRTHTHARAHPSSHPPTSHTQPPPPPQPPTHALTHVRTHARTHPRTRTRPHTRTHTRTHVHAATTPSLAAGTTCTTSSPAWWRCRTCCWPRANSRTRTY